jgi:hypothetical protein
MQDDHHFIEAWVKAHDITGLLVRPLVWTLT